MENIKFDDGLKEFSINNDENRILRFNPTDIALFDNIKHELESVSKKLEDKKITDEKQADKQLRKSIDNIFYSGASNIIFGSQNVLSSVNGETLFESFFKALLEMMKPYVEKEGKKVGERMKAYQKEHDRIVAENTNNK